ncbi:MAG: butyrate kinase [Candidatus Riflebacteria bacterium]|nr:butyrate kinase [Candidatus Riflebacteria bacterium]
MSGEKTFRLLVINPGSTSTKLGIFENETCVCEKTLRHSATELEKYDKVWDQYEFRKKEIVAFLVGAGYDLATFHAVVGRGGLLRPMESGTYRVDQHMISDLRIGYQGQHASNLGGVLAYGIGWDYSLPSYIVDPVAVDEFEPISRFSGMADIPRLSTFHALNIRAVARKAAKDMGKRLDELNLIVAHLGGGITVAALRKGRVIEVNHGMSEGPFSPERAGAVPVLPLVDLCFSGKYDKKTIVRKLVGGGGLVGYLGTNNVSEVESMVKAGNSKARLVLEAMSYQIAVEIGARAVALYGKIDAIILTGGIANVRMVTSWIEERVAFLGKVLRYPGEDELGALAQGGLRVLRGEEVAKIYDAQKKSIGIYFSDSLPEYDRAVQNIESRLKEAGFRFRQPEENLEIVIRNCHGDPAKMHEVIGEFLARKLDLIIAIGSPAATAAKTHLKKRDVPVVCVACFDPVVMGLASSYAGSGNNIAGSSYRVEVAQQIATALEPLVPDLKRLGVVCKSGELQSEIQLDEVREVAARQGFEVTVFDVRTPADLAAAAIHFATQKVQAVFLPADTVSAVADEAALAPVVRSFPTLCALELVIQRGGLAGRIADWDDLCRRGAGLAIEILEGKPPGTLPIYRNPAARTVINPATAKTLGLKLPPAFLESATPVEPLAGTRESAA